MVLITLITITFYLVIWLNLAKDGLHINEGGMRKFASNVNRYIRYC